MVKQGVSRRAMILRQAIYLALRKSARQLWVTHLQIYLLYGLIAAPAPHGLINNVARFFMNAFPLCKNMLFVAQTAQKAAAEKATRLRPLVRSGAWIAKRQHMGTCPYLSKCCRNAASTSVRSPPIKAATGAHMMHVPVVICMDSE